MGIKWKTDHLRKGDVFKDKEGKEYMFLGWWQSEDLLLGRKAIATLYRTEKFEIRRVYDGIKAIPEEDMVKHEDWIGGYMIGEDT